MTMLDSIDNRLMKKVGASTNQNSLKLHGHSFDCIPYSFIVLKGLNGCIPSNFFIKAISVEYFCKDIIKKAMEGIIVFFYGLLHQIEFAYFIVEF